ncbi:DUF3850 domain-containing protein [Hymenobacter sp. BT635]|uniref:DUF3850 domain-containing protein n=1 Tax=Hymenobacter nitidus TaxID=2880929 RepID=A0ABS8AE11_9BACT|nr:ASCH/PUA domain-containing protein [Hymenobacter nitidus]MCB2378645.1 DUF3850 domain-containing protein [Hymenobacter nitidus]
MKTTNSLPEITSATSPRRTHELKIWPACFTAVESGAKPFDVRENDRDFRVGDVLLLREYEPETEQYSGRTVLRAVSYVLLGGSFGLEAGWCVVGFGSLPPLPPGINDTKLW